MSDINKMLAIDPEQIQAPALKEAFQALQKENREKEAKKALEALQNVSRVIDNQVREVRQIREQEKKAITRLKELDAAQKAFMKDGDCAKLNKVVRGY